MAKIIRDLGILLAFCGAFCLLIVFVRGDSTKAATSSNFSMDRLEGDRMMKEENWEQAIVHFARLIEKDPYNGLAQSNLIEAEVAKLYEDGADFVRNMRAETYSKDEAKAVRIQLRADAARCIEIQDRLMRFQRYRALGLRNLAALNCFLGKKDEAMTFLNQYAEEGDFIGLPIGSDPKLGSLRTREDFRKLLRIERRFLPHYDMGHDSQYYYE